MAQSVKRSLRTREGPSLDPQQALEEAKAGQSLELTGQLASSNSELQVW